MGLPLRRSDMPCPILVFLASFQFFKQYLIKVLTKSNLSVRIIFAVNELASDAGVAQLVEQLICNQQVGGSNPSTSSTFFSPIEYGGVPKWPKGTDCKSAGFAFDGSNPSSSTTSEQATYRLLRFFIKIRARSFCCSSFQTANAMLVCGLLGHRRKDVLSVLLRGSLFEAFRAAEWSNPSLQR